MFTYTLTCLLKNCHVGRKGKIILISQMRKLIFKEVSKRVRNYRVNKWQSWVSTHHPAFSSTRTHFLKKQFVVTCNCSPPTCRSLFSPFLSDIPHSGTGAFLLSAGWGGDCSFPRITFINHVISHILTTYIKGVSQEVR